MNTWKSEPIPEKQMTDDGKYGEKMARLLLKKKGYWLGQIDWCGIKDNKLIMFEIKYKKKFTPPPFIGHGLDIRQINNRMKIYEITKLPTFFMVLDKEDNNWYVQWLHKLESADPKDKFDTKFGIRIYKLELFTALPNFENPLQRQSGGVSQTTT